MGHSVEGAIMIGRNIVYASLLVLYGCITGAQYNSCTSGVIDWIQNGNCDFYNNNESCDYDGGDCCGCTCISGLDYDCGANDFFCRDPNSGCVDPRVDMYLNCTDGHIPAIGDGRCDAENSNEGCYYDGGDCCECTCITGRDYDCGAHGFFCRDPNSGCSNPRIDMYPNYTIDRKQYVGDGWCDIDNNSESCDYDGGDCCECTCNSEFDNVCGANGFFCRDPTSDCIDPRIEMYPNCTEGYIPYIQDGYCDNNNNNEECDYDGGDCCECTCNNGLENNCGANGFFCRDPNSGCIDPRIQIYPNCTDGYIPVIGDGRCDVENNHEGCDYDGGDCCQCTCTYDHNCGLHGFSCIDSDVADLESYICSKLPPTNASCPAAPQREWVVGNTAQARSLAETVRCPGGLFHVTRKGEVILNETIYVTDGTILYVTSGDANASIVGDGETQLFSVVNASLYLSNVAIRNGNAIYGGAIAASRSTLTFERVTFDGNKAIQGGGALSLSDGAIVSLGKHTVFVINTAYAGGAIYVTGGINVSCTGNTTFSENAATSGDGGAIYATDRSSLVWTASSLFLDNNAEKSGGALYLSNASSATWNAESTFSTNNANTHGGALYLSDDCSATWTAESTFSTNRAGSDGGALYLSDDCSATWTAESTFSTNRAGSDGGALYLSDDCSATWTAESTFSSNTAQSKGGALHLSNSNATWNAVSGFSTNSAEDEGGVLYSLYDSNVTWNGESFFYANMAQSDGGAVYVNRANVLWNGCASFVSNTARNGGAIYVNDGATAEWTRQTNFTSNSADVNGGAVGSRAPFEYEQDSVITIKGATSFANNTCGANGGGMALVQSTAVFFERNKIIFSYNSAGASGGAVFVTGTAFGVVFMNVVFLSNHAPTGGGVRITESAAAITIYGENQRVVNPTTFVGCKFVYNSAIGTGGAVDSASGQDLFDDTLFEGNYARVGGGLRLAGTASIVNCSFVDNASDLGGGAAVSNIGYISTVTNVSFHGNVFNCGSQTFLEFKVEDSFTAVCDGCPETCVGCSFGGEQKSPVCTSLPEAGIYHASSQGGITTLEGLYIHKGYWRATNSSPNIHKCFNTEACLGGMTGPLDFCLSGYEGPYCSVCSKNYVSSLNFTCRKCSDNAVSFAIAAIVTVLIAAIGLAIVSYMLSTEGSDAGRGLAARVMQRLSMQSVKIIIVVWQILTQFVSVSSVTFPHVYQTLLDGVNFLNFDLIWAFSAKCFIEIDFHDRLLWTTIPPIVIMVLLGGAYAVAVLRKRETPRIDLSNVRQKYVSMALMVMFLVYSSVSSVVFQMFACEGFDDGKRYLRADYTIDCDSLKHRTFQFYASLMMLVYPLGIPAIYAVLLFKNRRMLQDENGRGASLVARSTSSLWKPYKPKMYYYEVIECSRRIFLAGAVVFIYPNSDTQIAVAVAIAVVFVFVSEALSPFHSPWDAWTSRLGHAIVFVSMYLALLLKVDVSGEHAYSQKAFEVILVAAHGCMVLLAVVETGVMALSLRGEGPREKFMPRRRRPSNVI